MAAKLSLSEFGAEPEVGRRLFVPSRLLQCNSQLISDLHRIPTERPRNSVCFLRALGQCCSNATVDSSSMVLPNTRATRQVTAVHKVETRRGGWLLRVLFCREAVCLRDYTLTRPPATGPAFTYAIAFIFGFAFTLLAVHPKKPTSQAAEDGYPETSMQ